jgi:hypothetical protein
LAGAAIAVTAIVATPQLALARDVALSAASLILYTLAAFVALFGWSRPVPPRGLSYRDVAGVLVVIGILVSINVEPDQLIRLVTSSANQG